MEDFFFLLKVKTSAWHSKLSEISKKKIRMLLIPLYACHASFESSYLKC